jgi:hypothetical protein
MSWERATDTEDLVEWERDDGAATIRLRAHPNGAWVVRLDRMFQAPEGGTYRRERAETRAAGVDLAEAWREEFDSPEE